MSNTGADNPIADVAGRAAGHVADILLPSSVLTFFGISIADATLFAQFIVTVLSGIGVVVAIWYHVKAARHLK